MELLVVEVSLTAKAATRSRPRQRKRAARKGTSEDGAADAVSGAIVRDT